MKQNVTLWYDTNCNLCLRYIKFIERHDKYRVTTFASIYEHESAQKEVMPGSIILDKANISYVKSDAVLEHWKLLNLPLRIMGHTGYVIPRFIRDRVYDYVARNRYKWFGTCDCK